MRPEPLPRRGPPRHPDFPLLTVGLRLPARIIRAADTHAARHRLTRSEVLRVAIDAGLRQATHGDLDVPAAVRSWHGSDGDGR